MKKNYRTRTASKQDYHVVIMKLIGILLLIICFSNANSLQAQKKVEGDKAKKESKSKPVKRTFENMQLINGLTIESPKKNSLHFGIQHRFGRIDQGFKEGNNFDLFGLLGVANIRIGLIYGITDRLSVGCGTTKKNYTYDLQVNYKILNQNKSNSIPVSISYAGNVAYVSIKNSKYKSFSNRLTYFNQLNIGRKINNTFSFQLSPSQSYFNLVDTLGGKMVRHLNFGLGLSAKIQINSSGSLIVEYTQPLTVSDFGGGNKTKPGIGIGYEIATRGHVFQLFITNAISLTNQYNLVENTNDFLKGQVYFGFNISRSWNF